MNYSDRVKEATTATSTATIALAGASAGFRTFSAGFAVGTTGIAVCVADSAGNWEIGTYTLTNSGMLTRESVLTSSNNNAAVTFPAGTKDVFCTIPSALLNSGLINPNDPGFDIILLLGQSNMVGQDTPVTALDIVDSRIFAYGCYVNEASTYRKITQAVDPLRHNYAQASLPGVGNGSGLGPGSWLARTYAGMTPSNRKVLLVPCARSSTKLFADTREWFPGDGTVGSGVALGAAGSTLLDNAIDQATRAVAEAQLMYPNSRVVGIAWHQGEGDADYYGLNLSLNYQGAQKTLIQAIRTRVPTAANAWFVIGGLMGENVADTAGHPGYAAVDNAHRTVAAEVARCAYTPGLTGYKMGDNLHYTAAGARILGCNMASVIPVAMLSRGVDTTAPVTRSATVYAADTYTVAWAVSEPVDPNFVPPASAFTLTGHTALSVRVQGNYIYVTFAETFVGGEAARTLIYTASAAGSNGLRDLAGNVMANASQGVTNNAPTVDTTAPTLTSASATATGTTTANGSVTTNEANGTLYYFASANATETAATVKASGATVAISSTGSKAVSVTGLTAGTTYYMHFLHRDAAGNDSTVADTASFTTSAADTTAPTLSSPVGTATGATTATATVSTNEAGGTLYYMVSTNSTETATTVKAGSSQAVTASGTQNVSFTGLSANTTYYSHFLHKDAANNESAVANGPGFTTQAASGTDLNMTDLRSMTQTVATPPYTFKTNSAINYDANPNGATTPSSMAGDGVFMVKLATVSARHFLGLKATAPTTNYGSLTCLFMAETSGYKLYYPDANSTTYVTGRVPVDNDWVRMTRVGTNVTYAVSSDGGTTWTDIAKQANVSGTKWLQILSQANGQFIAPQGTGFA